MSIKIAKHQTNHNEFGTRRGSRSAGFTWQDHSSCPLIVIVNTRVMSLIKDPLARPQCSSFLQLKACSWARRICAEEIYIMPNNMDEDGNYFYMPII